jgi:putative transcriptional regulator
MKIDDNLTDLSVLQELGARLEHARLERNLTQRELAAQSGVARQAVQRVEAGDPVTTVSLVRIMRALGLAELLDQLAPQATPSPVELLELRGKRRQRASGRRRRRPPTFEPGAPWRWGDEAPATES